MKRLKQLAIVALALSASFSHIAFSDDEPVVLPIYRLTVDMAMTAAQATLEACRKQGLNVSVSIVDRGGHAQVILRDTLAMPLSLTISEQKANAAMNLLLRPCMI